MTTELGAVIGGETRAELNRKLELHWLRTPRRFCLARKYRGVARKDTIELPVPTLLGIEPVAVREVQVVSSGLVSTSKVPLPPRGL
jgi:hypothetical protein